MKTVSASLCVGVAAWCSLGTVGLIGTGSSAARIALLPPWWLLPALVAVAFVAIRLARLSTSELWPLFSSALAILPWLPVPLPAAALVWTGPFLVGVWGAVIVGVIVTKGWIPRARWLVDPTRARLLAGALAILIYIGNAWWLSPMPPSGDAPHYLVITQSLLRDGDIKIENNHLQGDYLEYYPGALKPDYLRRGTNGEIYSIHAPGLPALIAPAFYLFGLPGATAFLALVSAIGTAFVWHLGYRVTGSAGAAWFGWACSALTSPFLFSATAIFPDGLAATLVLLGSLPLIDPEAERLSWRSWLVAGISLAILPWLGSRLALVSVAAAICLIFRIRRVSQFVSVAVPGAVSAALWFGFFYAIYHTFSPSAPYGTYTQMAVVNLTRSIPGFLFDEQFGLIPNAPVYGFILAGVIAAAARLRRWSWEILIVSVPYMIAVGMWMIWWAGTSSPARYWTPATLLLGIASARLWHETTSPVARAIGLTSLGVSVLIAVVLLVPDRGGLLINFRDGVALWLEWANDLIDVPRGLPSLFHDTLAHVWAKAGIWSASLAAAWLALRVIHARAARASEPHRRAILSLATPWCLALAVMIALSLSWRVDGSQPLTPETAELTLLGHASAFRSIAYDYSARQFKSSPAALQEARLRTSGRRPVSRPAPLLFLSRVPAGTYRVRLTPAGEAAGTLLIKAGSTQLPMWIWNVTRAPSGPIETPIRLPVGVRSLTIDGDDQARRTLAAVELEPVLQGPLAQRGPFENRAARTGARYRLAETYFLDEHAYAEPQGLWVAGGEAASMVIANHVGPLQLFLRNAPVPNRVTIELEGERQQLDLGPGEEKTIVLPKTGQKDISLRVEATNGFRPWQTDHSNADMRLLGCWVEIR